MCLLHGESDRYEDSDGAVVVAIAQLIILASTSEQERMERYEMRAGSVADRRRLRRLFTEHNYGCHLTSISWNAGPICL
jgi:hypothetical protein